MAKASVSKPQKEELKNFSGKVVQIKGTDFKFLNPAGKSQKYATELKEGVAYTNFGQKKVDKDGKIIELKEEDKIFRRGFLQSRQDNADAYNAKNNPEKLREARKKRKEKLDKWAEDNPLLAIQREERRAERKALAEKLKN